MDLKVSVPAVAACGTRVIRGKQWLRVVDAASAAVEGSGRVNCGYVPSHTNALHEEKSRTRGSPTPL